MILSLLISLLIAGPLKTFLEPVQKRDSILVADQLRYGIVLENVEEGTPLALPEFKTENDSPIEFLGEWQLDSTRVSKKKETPARYDIMASMLITTWMGGSYQLPDIPVLFAGDTLVFSAPEEPLEVTEPSIDMETYQVADIKDQVKFPYTFKEVAPWVLGALVVIGLIYLLISWLIRNRRHKAEQEKAEPAHLRALRRLDELRGDKFWKADKQKYFYSGVTDALREYIVARYGVGAMEMTTAEIFRDLKGSDIPEDLYQEMKDLFERADFVKFAKFTATDEENAKVLPEAIRFVTTTYQSQVEKENAEKKEEEE